MDNNIEYIHDWSESVISQWKAQKIPLQKGATLAAISKTEKILEFTFPLSFKVLYQKVDGFEHFEWNENMIGIWQLSRMENEFGRYSNFVGFGDFLINSCSYGFLKDQPGIFKAWDLAYSTPLEKIAESFEEAIDLILANTDLLY